jgi:hypothetical protein
LAAICAGASASGALAATPVEGVWGFGDGRVEITPGGSAGLFTGVVTRPLTFSHCMHPRGERMWSMLDMLDGTYRGRHVNYLRQTCERDPGAPALWRVRKTARGEVLDFCANDPGGEEPEGFGPNCHVLERVAPARDLARACASGVARASRAGAGRDVCIHGPAELRRTGCVRRRGRVTHRFVVKLEKRMRGRRRVHPRARVKSVKFSLDRKSRSSDRAAPFERRIEAGSLTAGAHVLAAEVLMRAPESNKPVRRRVTFRFDACA